MVKARKHSYSYEIDQCDVQDKAKLTEFRTKYSEWIGWFDEDPHHNICDQIYSIMWNDAAYRAMNEARKFASEENPSAARNGMLGEFLDRGYISTQVLDLCKITDSPSPDAKKGVISLRRLVGDIQKNCLLLTRENYVCHDGLPYDYETVRRAYLAQLTSEQLSRPHWAANTGPGAWDMSCRLHEMFDLLSGVAREKRTRHDLINSKVFEVIDKWMDAPILETLRVHRNKFIGHAADFNSRQLKPLSRLGLTLDELAEAQRIVIRVANAIGSYVLCHHGVGDPVPTAQFDVLENLEFPMLQKEHMSEMIDWWHDHGNERAAWTRERFDFFSGKIESF